MCIRDRIRPDRLMPARDATRRTATTAAAPITISCKMRGTARRSRGKITVNAMAPAEVTAVSAAKINRGRRLST